MEKNENGNILLGDKAKRMLFVGFAFVLLYLGSYLLDPFNEYWRTYFDRRLEDIIKDWISVLIVCILISESGILIHKKLNRTLSWTKHLFKRVAVESVLNVIAVVLILYAYDVLSALFRDPNLVNPPFEKIRGFANCILPSLMASFVIVTIHTWSYLIANWKNTETQVAVHQLREAEWKQEAVEAELNALKLQIDPHFIFNNLGVLSELILKDQQLGHEYAEHFTKVYRFLLVNSKNNMIPLKDELRFLNSYIFLIRYRKGDAVSFELNVDRQDENLFVPPMTMQLLIENALKHNKANKRQPLVIKIYSEKPSGTLIIENSFFPIENPHECSTGVGLSNIIHRFELLGATSPEVVQEKDRFKVIIHLIAYDQKNSHY